MHETFGARLRRCREERSIALATIAEQTKIKASLLEALERDDVSHWPSGIFRRSFLRAYAQAIGQDPDPLVREFLELYPDPVDVAAAAADAESKAAVDAARANGIGSTLRSAVAAVFGRRRVPAEVPEAPALPAREPEPEAAPDPDLPSLAELCTAFGRIGSSHEIGPLLKDAAGVLDATGLIVWTWDAPAGVLKPVLAHGYSDRLLGQLPPVARDAENLTAAAFRAAETRVAAGGDRAHGALVVPLLTTAGCIGVLAVELRLGREQTPAVRAAAAILAAQLGHVVRPPAAQGHRPKRPAQHAMAGMQ